MRPNNRTRFTSQDKFCVVNSSNAPSKHTLDSSTEPLKGHWQKKKKKTFACARETFRVLTRNIFEIRLYSFRLSHFCTEPLKGHWQKIKNEDFRVRTRNYGVLTRNFRVRTRNYRVCSRETFACAHEKLSREHEKLSRAHEKHF